MEKILDFPCKTIYFEEIIDSELQKMNVVNMNESIMWVKISKVYSTKYFQISAIIKKI